MRVNLNINMQQNKFLNAERINKSLSPENYKMNIRPEDGKKENKDKVSISPFGKAASMIEALMKQKQNIMENRSKLISSTLENGGDMESIKPQLEMYDEQLKNLEEQISRTIADQAKEQLEKPKEKKEKEPKTEEEINQIRTESLLDSATALEQSKVVQHVQTEAKVRASDLKMEIENDSSISSTPASRAAISIKQDKLSDLEQQIDNLGGDITAILHKANEGLEESNELIPEEESVAKDETDNIKEIQDENVDGEISKEASDLEKNEEAAAQQ